MSDIHEKARNEIKDIDMLESFFSDDDQMTDINPDLEQQLREQDEFDLSNPIFLYRMFYNSFFPYKSYFNWLNYDTTPTKNFTHREFSFTLPSDIYIRFQSFSNSEELKKEIERLQPAKIDIGAVYAVKPRNRKTVSEKAFKPLEKELVFDIDMTDYDEIRTCCSGGDVCLLCWEFMTVAIKIIDVALREDFGFKHIMWVYSGRRGVHCWVCDERARKLDNDARKAIVNYLDVIKGGAQMSRKVKLFAPLHPSLRRSYQIVEKHFESLVLQKMGILDKPENWKKLLEIIPDADVREKIDESWRNYPNKSPKEKWNILVNLIEKADKKKRFKRENLWRDIMFQYCYPRLDIKVSTAINHLLKSPFCVHPKTLRVCVPIKVEECEKFDPLSVPTLMSLRRELTLYKEQTKNITPDKKMADYKKTSLKPYIDYFDKFVMDIIINTKKSKRDEAVRSMEF
ncbi:DNA primase small subunit-like protein [Cokeromyces recurvatus]|uniref:DNA primase small subunit-like protein n=1 Tax=Cokeromyces recurvatus TaxID=90255 RepID=UPI00221FC98F|nr:DNA primase small subunit-like protein [Cokeromyces recurvatus]KAI7898605.1 DNA primase small subunit-like protein [Cokeromyces recurvatus]